VQEGMTEREAMKMAFEVFKENGVTKHWHKPYVRFGPGTALSFNDPLQSDYRLQKDDPFYIDLGPAWRDEETGIEYEGDVGNFLFLAPMKKRLSASRWHGSFLTSVRNNGSCAN
jgi:hypothetical protein